MQTIFLYKQDATRTPIEEVGISIDRYLASVVVRRFAVAEIKPTNQTLTRLQVMNYSDYVLVISSAGRYRHLSKVDGVKFAGLPLTFILRTTPHVVHLDVGGCVELYDQSGVYIAEQLSQLKTLNMSCTKIKNETMSALAKHHADTLQALSISDCWGVESDALCKVLQNCTTLRVLHTCAWTVKNCYETIPEVLQHVAYLTLDVFCESGCF